MSGNHPADHPAQTGLEAAASRPSKTNCTSHADGPTPADVRADRADSTEEKLTERAKWWKAKNELVDEFVDDRSSRAARPVSVRDDVSLREEAVQERREDGYRARTWSTVLNEFLAWYNDYRTSHLLFVDPDGDEVRAPMPNSHQPSYGDKYYAKLKALERQMVDRYDDLHVAMLTLSGSSTNANGGWRCPVDHLRDVVNSWRPDEGRGVYHALRDALDAHQWEYALVTEKHDSGYGHVHVAVFVDGEVGESDFHSAIDAHLSNCDIAHRDAHDYHHPEEEVRPISVREVDTDLDLEDLDANADDVEAVANVGSYVGEYIGSHGEDLFDRGIDELSFRAACWASGTQMVRFSTGANEMIDDDLESNYEPPEHAVIGRDPGFDEDDPEGSPFEVIEGSWEIRGICSVDRTGESRHDLDQSSVSWHKVEPSAHLDPPKQLPPDRPQRRTEQTSLGD